MQTMQLLAYWTAFAFKARISRVAYLDALADVNPKVRDSLHEGRVAAFGLTLGALSSEELLEVAEETEVLFLFFLLGLLLVVAGPGRPRVLARRARLPLLEPTGQTHANPLMKKAHAGFSREALISSNALHLRKEFL